MNPITHIINCVFVYCYYHLWWIKLHISDSKKTIMECYELLPVLQTRRIFIVQLQENCADQQGKGHWQSNLDVHVVTTSGQRILTKGRIAGVEACTGDNVCDTDQSWALQPAIAVPLSPLLIFLLRKLPQHRFTMFFSGPDNPQNCPFSWGNIDLRLTHDSLGPPESILQSASQSVRPFLQGSWTWTNRQTHTDRQTTLLATNRVYALSPCDAA